MSDLAETIYARVRNVVGPGRVGLHEPVIGEQEREAVDACLRSGYVSSVGEWVLRFESALAEKVGVAHAVAMSSGTSALQVALRVGGVTPGDEVLVPAMSFVATANAVTHHGAIAHFVDISRKTLGMDVDSVRDLLESSAQAGDGRVVNPKTGRRISAIMPMHCFGHPVELAELQTIALQFAIPIIEDAAEGLGSLIGNQHVGSTSLAGVLSFNGNKIVTTGGGGAILTNSAEFAAHARHLSTTAKIPHPWEFDHDEVGYNFRMPNVNAALGWAQLQQLDGFLSSKRALARAYLDSLGGDHRFSVFDERPGTTSNFWLNTLILEDEGWQEREDILSYAHSRELQMRPAWKLLPDLEPYRNNPRSPLPVAVDLAKRIVNLPSSAFLRQPEQ